MVTKIEHLLKRYLLNLNELINHMREHFGVYIILDENVYFHDLIEEAKLIYDENQALFENR